MTQIPRLMSLMTGDEKHSSAATSTLDVIRVLYERVLDVSPDDHRRRTAGPLLPVQGPRPDGLLRGPGRPRASSRSRGCRAGARSTRRSATTRTATSCPAWRSPRARSVTDSRWRSGTALGLRAQGIGSRVVVLVGDAELDEGSNHEALELAARPVGLDALTVVVVDNRSSQLRRAGPDRRPLRRRGLAHDVRRRA